MNPRVWAEFDHSLAKKYKYFQKKRWAFSRFPAGRTDLWNIYIFVFYIQSFLNDLHEYVL